MVLNLIEKNIEKLIKANNYYRMSNNHLQRCSTCKKSLQVEDNYYCNIIIKEDEKGRQCPVKHFYICDCFQAKT